MQFDFFFLGAALVGGYLLPTVVAAARGHRRAGWVLLLNLSCGWMYWGWGAAMIWAVAGEVSIATSNPSCGGSFLEPDPDPDDGERRPLLGRTNRVRRFRQGRHVRIHRREESSTDAYRRHAHTP